MPAARTKGCVSSRLLLGIKCISPNPQIIFISGSSVFLMIFGMMYKNVSFTVLKRLLREISVWILLVSVVLNFIIECARPATPVVDPIAAFVFLF